jgi:hypothetical protein
MNQPPEQSVASAEKTPGPGRVSPAPQSSVKHVELAAPLYLTVPATSERAVFARIARSRLAWLLLIVVLLGGFATYRIIASHDAAPEVAATDLKVGDCFNAASGSSGVAGTRVQQISCDQPHNSEVYAEPAATESSFLGAAYLHSDANDACQDGENESAVSMIVPAGYDLVDFYPDNASVFANDKKFICVIQFPSDTSESWLASDGAS